MEQSRFESRVIHFINTKTFSGRENFEVTPEVKVTVAASAVQLTFGLETWDLSFFNHILMYASDYKSPSTGKYHKGETNMGGFMCFSWKAFLEGNAEPHDKINLGLHEFAHALRFNGIRGDETDYFFENYFPRWLSCALNEYRKLKNDFGNSIFRKYGGVNINEFFSVAVETFFELPLEFKAYSPELYKHTSILLNQTFTDKGVLVLNCRYELMNATSFKMSQSYEKAITFNLRYNGLSIGAALFFIVGIITLTDGGYLYPSPYILFGIAVCTWLLFETHYTRIAFGVDSVTIKKGFALMKGYRTLKLPYSNLISFTATYEYKKDRQGNIIKKLSGGSVTYYRNQLFYEEDLNIDAVQPQFDELCRELKEHHMHVFINE